MIFYQITSQNAQLRAPISSYKQPGPDCESGALMWALGRWYGKKIFIWLTAPPTGTHFLQLLYESVSGVGLCPRLSPPKIKNWKMRSGHVGTEEFVLWGFSETWIWLVDWNSLMPRESLQGKESLYFPHSYWCLPSFIFSTIKRQVQRPLLAVIDGDKDLNSRIALLLSV